MLVLFVRDRNNQVLPLLKLETPHGSRPQKTKVNTLIRTALPLSARFNKPHFTMAIATSTQRPGHFATPSKEVHLAPNEDEKNWLVVSPYDERPHQLDLRRVDTSCQLLAKALVNMRSLREDYATAPYTENFNFDECAEELRTLISDSGFDWKEKDFYIVVFRSQIPPSTVYSDLGILDKAAHEEAIASGGFLK